MSRSQAPPSASIWWYRFLMLVWALWLAASTSRWLRRAWQQFSTGKRFRKMEGNKVQDNAPPDFVRQETACKNHGMLQTGLG